MNNISEYIKEAELFSFSLENFNIEKDCHELNLISLYIESSEYIEKNKEYSSIFTEAYIDDYRRDAMRETFWKKFIISFTKILNIILKPFRAIYAFLKSYFTKEENEDKKIEPLWNTYQKIFNHKIPVVEGMKLPDEEVAKPLLEALNDFKSKHPKLWRDVVDKNLYGINHHRGLILDKNDKYHDVYLGIRRIIKYSYLGDEEEKFLENLFTSIKVRKYEVPTFFATIFNNKESLMNLGIALKKTFSKKKVVNPILTAKDLKLTNALLQKEHDSKDTYLLHIDKAQELLDTFKGIVRGIEEAIQVMNSFLSNEENLKENTDKQREGFMELLNEVKNTLKILQSHTPHAIKKLVTHKDNINAMRNFWKRIIPLVKAVEDNVMKNKNVDNYEGRVNII